MSNKVTKTFNCKRRFKINSSEPLDSEDISVQVGSNKQANPTTNPSEQPNVLALAILWANFQACHQELLSTDSTPPWNKINKGRWGDFLNQLIADSDWKEWIHNPQQVKEKTRKAYNNLK
ncbi:hypothetical protein [Halanaerobaculum tunisiense]